MPDKLGRRFSDGLAAALASSCVLGLIGLLSVGFHEAFLAPSLASAAFSQVLHPTEPGAKTREIFVGQLIGAVAGFAAVLLTSQMHAPPLTGSHAFGSARVLCATIAVLVSTFTQSVSGFRTPAGGATALVIALGVESFSWSGALRIVAGIVLVTVLGEIARAVLLARQKRRVAEPAE